MLKQSERTVALKVTNDGNIFLFFKLFIFESVATVTYSMLSEAEALSLSYLRHSHDAVVNSSNSSVTLFRRGAIHFQSTLVDSLLASLIFII